MSRWQTAVMAFIKLHGILLCLTLGSLILAFLAAPVTAPALVLALPLLAAWIVALSRSDALLRTVGGMDERFLRSYEKARHGGKFRRWVLRPLYWMTDNWNAFATRAPDPHAFAALRLFGYIILVMVVIAIAAALAYAIVITVIVIAMLALAMFILGAVLDVDPPRKPGRGGVLRRTDPLLGAGGRGRDILAGKGGWFGHEEKAGRVDADGNIYEGKGGWFGHEEKIGRIDEDGNIYEGKGGLFGHEEKVGRRGEDGDIYEGKGGLFGHEEKIGRRDSDGTIYRGKGGWFGHEEKIGRLDD